MNELLPSVPILYMSTFNFADLSTACISSSEAKTSPNVKTVLISVIKEGGGIEYAIAPLKTSYPVTSTMILASAIPLY
jgi:hypothetical protein